MAYEQISPATRAGLHPRRVITVVALVVSLLASVTALTAPAASAQQPDPTIGDTGRLLGHLWADGSYDDGVWDATGPSGGHEIIERLVNDHGGSWLDRTQLRFTLPAPYDWEEWKGSLPNDDARTQEAVQHPNFLAALIEGEGSVAGLVYDQSSCCTAGFTEGRLTELRDLLLESGFVTTTLTMFSDLDSGRINIGASEFAELRAGHVFVCPSAGTSIRIPGAEDYATYGPIQWLDASSEYGDVVRPDCVDGQPIPPASNPIGDCVVTSDGGGQLRLTWTFQRGLVTIRRDGAFVTSVSALDQSMVDAPIGGTYTYELRVTADGLQTNRTCGTLSTAAASQAAPTPGQTCAGKIITHMGTSGDDVIKGTAGADVIHGYSGDDEIFGLQGADLICGGSGADTVHAGQGNDTVWGGQGFDVLYGAQGNDALHAVGADEVDSVGGSRMFGGAGHDILEGSTRWDRMQGGPGQDWLRGYSGRDWIRGGAGNDRVFGDAGIDDLHGGNDTDFIVIDGLDTVRGGAGNDGCQYESVAELVLSCELTIVSAAQRTSFIAAMLQ